VLKWRAKVHDMIDAQFIARIMVGWGYIPTGVTGSCDFFKEKGKIR